MLLQKTRQHRNPIDIGHIDVKNDDIRRRPLDLLDRIAAAAQRRDDTHIRLGLDPARNHGTDDDGVVDHHHADAIPRVGGAWR